MVGHATRPCVECGAPARRMARTDRRWLCPDCAVAAVMESARQMAAKSGPIYTRWLDAVTRDRERLERDNSCRRQTRGMGA